VEVRDLHAQQRKTSLVVPILPITLGALFLFKTGNRD
jgi:hypothetical protein